MATASLQPKKFSKTNKFDVFISHSVVDYDIIEPFIRVLRNEYSLDLWIDFEQLIYGNKCFKPIALGINASTLVLCFVSANYLLSNICRNQIRLIQQFNKKCIFVMLDDISIDDTELSSISTNIDEIKIDLGQKTKKFWSSDDAKEKLLQSISFVLNKQFPIVTIIDERELHIKDFTDFNHIATGTGSVVYGSFYKNKEIAIKQLHLIQDEVNLENEIPKLKSVNHENLVKIYGYKNSLALKYIVYEYVDVKSLQNQINDSNAILNSSRIIESTINAMCYLHDVVGIVHGSLKSSNILTDGKSVVKITDYGLSCIIDERIGIKWKAPEQVKGSLCKASDVWSFGLVLREIFEKKPPFVSLSDEIVENLLLNESLNVLEHLPFVDTPLEFIAVIRDCLKRQIDARPKFAELKEQILSFGSKTDRTVDKIDKQNFNIKSKGNIIGKCSDGTVRIWKNGCCVKRISSCMTQLCVLKNGWLAGSIGNKIEFWYLKSGNYLYTLRAHSKAIECLTSLKNDAWLACGGSDGLIIIWNVETVQCVYRLSGHGNAVTCFAVFDNGLLVSGSKDKTIKVWNLESGKLYHTFTEHDHSVNSLAVIDGQTFASCSNDNTAKLWNIETKICAHTIKDNSKVFNHLAYLGDGSLALCDETTISIVNTDTRQFVRVLAGQEKKINGLRNLSNRYLVSCDNVGTVRLWDLIGQAQTIKCYTCRIEFIETFEDFVENFSHRKSFQDHIKLHVPCCSKAIERNQLDLNGCFASGSEDFFIKIWNSETGQCVSTLVGHTGTVNCLTNLNSNYLASGSGNGEIKIWNLGGEQCVQNFTEHRLTVDCLIFLKNKQFIASGSEDCQIKIWNVETAQCVTTLRSDYPIDFLFELENGHLASASMWMNEINIWNIEGKTCVNTLAGHRNSILSLIILKHYGNKLASSSFDATIKIWDTEKAVCVKNLLGHTAEVMCLVELGSGFLASGCSDSKIKIWNVEAEMCVFTLMDHTQQINSLVALNNDLFASASEDQTINIWNSTNGQRVHTLYGHLDSVERLTVFNNGRLGSGSKDKTVKLWNTMQPSCMHTFVGHTQNITCLTYLCKSAF